MTALAQIEETLSNLTASELAKVQTMLHRLQKLPKSAAARPQLPAEVVRPDRPDRPTFEEIKPLLEKEELTEEELEKIEQYNGLFHPLPKRPGSPITNEMVRQLRDELGV
jgi:hypothetical protein